MATKPKTGRAVPPVAPAQPKAPDLAELLGTADRAIQARIVTDLINRVQAPTMTLVIQQDLRSGQVTLQSVGQELDFDGMQQLLNNANQQLLSMRVEAAQQAMEAAKQAASPETQQPQEGTQE